MIYVLYDQEYDSVELVGAFEGPDGLNISKLRSQFNANFDHRTLGQPKYPAYKGPTVPMKYGTCSSGSFPEGSAIMDQSSPEYIAWERAYRKVQTEWNRKREYKLEEFRQQYPGRDQEEMFISYLKVEHGFKEVAAKFEEV